MTRLLTTVAGVLLVAASAQAQQAPPRDTRRPSSGALSIGGVVLAADATTPLRRAVVTLAAAELPRTRSTRTDAEGRYEFAGLPASGSFTVTASKAQYLTLEYGQRRPFEPGRTVALAGRSLTTVDFRLPRAAAISGSVLDTSGEPVEQMWVMAFRRAFVDGRAGPGGNIGGGATADEQGRFRIAGVPAGEYYLAAAPIGARGAMTLTVSGADVPGVTLLVGSGGTLAARIVSSTGDPLPFPPGRVELSARLLADPYVFSGVVRPTVKSDWTVEWTGVTGPRVIRATRLPAGWWMKAVLRGDRDVTDEVIEITHGQAITDLVVVLDDKPTDVFGAVRDSRGAPAADYTVIAFSPDSRRWTPESRFVRAARPDHTGVVRISGLPPGEYLVAAVEYVEQGQWLDPSYLESLRQRARRITLQPGERTEVELALPAGR